jgi:rare lipoprotein A
MTPRIPRSGLVVALLSASFALPAVALAGNGGAPAPAPVAAGQVDPSFLLVTQPSLFVGGILEISGTAADAANRQVDIQSRDASGAWQAVATTTADGKGSFGTAWEPQTSGEYELRAAITGALASDTTTASASRTILVYKTARASWYGPGFYGKHTACGQRLRRTTVGIANRHLPCGTQVAVTYRGRSMVVPVIDRGPYAHGIQWDLTAAVAKRLGVKVTSRIGVVPMSLSLDPPAL